MERFDPPDDGGLCPDLRSESVAAQGTELARFLFVWNALERVIAAVDPPVVVANARRAGPVTNAREFLRAELPDAHLPELAHYRCAIEEASHITQRHPQFRKLSRPLRPSETAGLSEVGLNFANAYRGGFAHGGIKLSVWDDLSVDPNVRLVGLAIRLSLFSMQLLAFASVRSHAPLLLRWGYGVDAREQSAGDVVTRLHLVPAAYPRFLADN